MALFASKEERQARRAERKRRRAERKRDRADVLDYKANQLAPGTTEEKATIVARDNEGRQISQDVQIRKEASAARSIRIRSLENRVVELEATVMELEEDLAEAIDALNETQGVMERKHKGGMMLSKGALGVMNAMLSFVNVGYRIFQPGARIASETLDALVDLDELDEQQKAWARMGRVALKALAYYDPKKGLRSIIESERSGAPTELV